MQPSYQTFCEEKPELSWCISTGPLSGRGRYGFEVSCSNRSSQHSTVLKSDPPRQSCLATRLVNYKGSQNMPRNNRYMIIHSGKTQHSFVPGYLVLSPGYLSESQHVLGTLPSRQTECSPLLWRWVSQNRGTVEVGRDLYRLSSPTPDSEQGQLHQVQGCVQVGLEHLQWWRLSDLWTACPSVHLPAS